MNKIFISHNQDVPIARSIKALINMLGAYGILVEDEPGAESPDKKSFRLMKESQGFLAVCTRDVSDEKGNYSPKANVALEIKEWQSLHKTDYLVIIKEDGCTLPLLLGNPSYCGVFEGVNILNALHRALSEFQSMGLIPYRDTLKNINPQKVELTDKEISLLNYLANNKDRKGYESVLIGQFKFTRGEWNAAIHKLETKLFFVIHNFTNLGKDYQLTSLGFDFLLEKKFFNKTC